MPMAKARSPVVISAGLRCAANPKAAMKMPHSVVTIHLIDEAGQPTVKARDEILDFFKMRLSE